MAKTLKRLPAKFYRSATGREPVREWLKEQTPEDRRVIGTDIMDVEYAWPLGMPLVRPLKEGLWEVRSNISDGRIARVLFCTTNSEMVLLHAFVKKTQQTPPQDIDLARKRMKGL